MKKFTSIFLSIILFFGCFTFFTLKSSAEDLDHTAEITWYYDYGSGWDDYYVWEGKRFASDSQLYFVKDSNGISASLYSNTNSLNMSNYRVSQHHNSNEPSITWGSWSTIYGTAVPDHSNLRYFSSGAINIAKDSVWNNFSMTSRSGLILFASEQDLFDYLEDPTNEDILEGGGVLEGGDILFPDPPIDWGQGPDEYGELRSDIPAPEFRVVFNSDGSIKHSIEFTNQIYNSREHGVYGLVLSVAWASVDDITIKKTGNSLKTSYSVFYESFDTAELFPIYNMPTTVDQIVRCPAFVNFDTNENSLSAFNNLLTHYPVSERTINANWLEVGSTFQNKFEDMLEEPSCLYNTPIFSCYYYRQMSDGKYYYGPSSTGSFNFPVSGTQWYIDNGGLGNLVPDKDSTGYDGGFSGSGPGWDTSYGNTDPLLQNLSNLNTGDLIQNLNSIFSLMREFPSFLTAIIGFLPAWLMTFIAVAIALLIAAGLIKMLL